MPYQISLPFVLVMALTGSPSAQRSVATPESTDQEATVRDVFNLEASDAARSHRIRAANVLEKALEQDLDRAALVDAIRRAAAELDATSTRAFQLRTLPLVYDEVDALSRAMERHESDLRFEPMIEAPLPQGWPATAPVGEVVLKRYPEYRMATTPMKNMSESTPFWRLFQHIQSNDIAMTAPVQMERSGENGESGRMAFLYESEETGPLGSKRGVEVIDVQPTFAISIGARGYRNPQRVEMMTARLEFWLADNATRFEPAGPARVMGYNSPMVSAAKRFFEVEIPLRRVERMVEVAASGEGRN